MAGVQCPACGYYDGEHQAECPTGKPVLSASRTQNAPGTPAWEQEILDREYFKYFSKERPRKVVGVGPDADVVTNDKGAKQSATPYRLDLLPPLAILRLAEVLAHGAAKYGDENWRGIAPGDHLNHALAHVFAQLAGDTQDDHPGHALCRMVMWFETLTKVSGK